MPHEGTSSRVGSASDSVKKVPSFDFRADAWNLYNLVQHPIKTWIHKDKCYPEYDVSCKVAGCSYKRLLSSFDKRTRGIKGHAKTHSKNEKIEALKPKDGTLAAFGGIINRSSKNPERVASGRVVKQSSILPHTRIDKPSKKKQKQFEQVLCKWIVDADIAVNSIQTSSFQEMLAEAGICCKVPDSKKIHDTIASLDNLQQEQSE
jgi:hypothetical protein